MRKLCLALLCLTPVLSWSQNEAYVLAKKLSGLSSLALNFESNEANLDESSLYSFYGAANDLYSATELQLCYDAKIFEGLPEPNVNKEENQSENDHQSKSSYVLRKGLIDHCP